MEKSESTISSLMGAAQWGDLSAADRLFSTLYTELHRMARRQLGGGNGATLSATTLLHEAYLDMAAKEADAFPDQARFMGYAARVMRGLIIDHARSRRAIKRGGQFEITSLSTNLSVAQGAADGQELGRLGEALDELAKLDSSLAQIVDLKFFCGFSFNEIAMMSGVSERTVQRKWEKARIFLHRSLRTDQPL